MTEILRITVRRPQKQYVCANQILSVVCAVQFHNLKAVKDSMELSFILEREDYQRLFSFSLSAHLFIRLCVCTCESVYVCK